MSPTKAGFDGLLPRRDAVTLCLAGPLEASLLAAPRREVPQIEERFEHALPTLGSRLQAEMPPAWTCSVGGSFVHGGAGRYQARRPDTGTACEIGDLLVVVEYRLGP